MSSFPSLPKSAILFALLFGATNAGMAQNWLAPPPEPPGNASTPEKVALGQALFWDEQLSSSQSVACGTCHLPIAGGSDPRSFAPTSTHPGQDGIFGTADDVQGSPGVVLSLADGLFAPDPQFGFRPQVTGRKAGSAINALLNTTLFWDGRAEFTYRNPVTGAVVLPAWAALESQAVVPPMSSVEMAHQGRDWLQAASELANKRALALSPHVPAGLESWIANRRYGRLFEEAFGTSGVDVDRIAMAIAAYERTLFADQTPLDDYMNGDAQALNAQQLRGLNLFQNKGGCVQCHTFPQLGKQQFHYTGVHEVATDLGRGAITGNAADDGKMLTPGLRNIALRGPYFHNGSAATLMEVIDFYDRGGDFDHANKSLEMVPIGFTSAEKADLHALLNEALTDPRVAAGSGVFARPKLRTEDANFHASFGTATAGSNGVPPYLVLDDPARLESEWRIAIADGLSFGSAWIGVDLQADVPGRPYLGVNLYLAATPKIQVIGPISLNADGYATVKWLLPSKPFLNGRMIAIQALLEDPGGPAGFSATAAKATPLLPGH
jgi:cytochrome c peroxidase